MERKRRARQDAAHHADIKPKRASRDVRPAVEPLRVNTHLDLVRVAERVHRRSLDLYRIDLTRLGVHDVSPSQVMMLFTIGGEELTVRDLIERGYYLGSTASYNLKRLVDTGYVDRTVSERDRRSARLRLSDKGRELCEALRKVDETYHTLVVRSPKDARDLEVAIKTLKRLEQAWSTALHFGNTQDI